MATSELEILKTDNLRRTRRPFSFEAKGLTGVFNMLLGDLNGLASRGDATQT